MAVHSGAFETRPRQLDEIPTDPGDPNDRRVRRLSLQVIAVILAVAALWSAQELLIPLVFAVLASCGLEPVHRRLVRMHVPRGMSAGLILIGVVSLFGWGTWALSRQATTFINQLPVLTQKVRDQLHHPQGALSTTVQPMQQAANELKRAADEAAPPPAKGVTRVQVETPAMRATDLLWAGTRGVFAFAVQAAIVLFLVFYLLASGDRYKQKLLSFSPLVDRHVTLEVMNKIMEQIERFLVARVVISAMVAGATVMSLAALNMSQALIWGIIAGVLNNIPYLGPTAATVAIALAGLVQFGSLKMALAVGGAAGFIAAIEGLAITPWIMGRAGRMNTGVVFVSLMFWGWIWGVWGMLFAIPIMMALKAIGDHVPSFHFVSEVLSE
jgi:predicted PurR-regulated permease PerM